MSIKKWTMPRLDKELAARLAEECGISPLPALLLVARGYDTAEKLEAFLGAEEWNSPFLLPDMEKAAARVTHAIEKYEKIAVYGDYDADGVTATAMLYAYLEARGADVLYEIPDREAEGYGLNPQAVDRLKEAGVGLIITVDNGISAAGEIAYARSLGIDTVVTDHHHPPERLPEAAALVDPYLPACKSPFRDLCGAGVAFKLIAALEGEEADVEELFGHFADLLAIGTVADLVPLIGENRLFVRRGLQLAAQTDRPGLRALLQGAGLELGRLSSGSLAFGVAPRVNAAGRLGSAKRAVRLFLSDYEEEAESLAAELEEENNRRKQLEADIFADAAAMLRREPHRALDRVLVLAGEGWHPGVIGIVASRLVERYGKPCILIAEGEGEATGSGRSVAGFSLIDAVTACAPLLTRFGGHTMAAGMSLAPEQIEPFAREINRYAALLPGPMPDPVLKLDCKLNPAGLSARLADELMSLEPFGAGNPSPLFGLARMTLEGVTPVGGGKHLRLAVSRDGICSTAMLFGTSEEDFPYRKGDMLDLAVALEKNTYRGEESLTLIVRDYKPSALNVSILLEQKAAFEAFARGEALPAGRLAEMRPARAQAGALYRLLKAGGREKWSVAHLCYCLKDDGIGYDTLMVALHAMRQAGLIRFSPDGGEARISLCEVEGKAALEQTAVMQNLARGEGGMEDAR